MGTDTSKRLFSFIFILLAVFAISPALAVPLGPPASPPAAEASAGPATLDGESLAALEPQIALCSEPVLPALGTPLFETAASSPQGVGSPCCQEACEQICGVGQACACRRCQVLGCEL